MIEPLEKTAAVRSGDSRSRLMIDNQNGEESSYNLQTVKP
jgi:hypothetical protein